jgi:hypothetical protein
MICVFVLQRRRASIAAFRPLDSQDSTKTSNTSLTFGVSSQCEGRVVYCLVRLLFIFVSTTTTSVTCLGPHRVLRVLPLQLEQPKCEDDYPLPSSTEVSDAYSCNRMISIYLPQRLPTLQNIRWWSSEDQHSYMHPVPLLLYIFQTAV